MAKLGVIFELGGVPTEAKYTNLTEQQWSTLGYFATLKRQKVSEEILDAVEYLAMLTSPHPKETMKVIDGRRKAAEKLKADAGLSEYPEKKLFKEEHRNTTFFDDIEKHVGKESADLLRAEQGGATSSVEKYELDFEDLEYISQVKRQQQELEDMKKVAENMNTVVF